MHTVRLAAINEYPFIDHTGDTISFSDVGSGDFDVPPFPWICYSDIDVNNVEWQFPNGTAVVPGSGFATEDQLFTQIIGGGIALLRGPTHNSPDGEYCCVRTGTSERLCVTFSE